MDISFLSSRTNVRSCSKHIGGVVKKVPYAFPEWLYHFTFPSATYEFFYILISIWYYYYYYLSHSDKCTCLWWQHLACFFLMSPVSILFSTSPFLFKGSFPFFWMLWNSWNMTTVTVFHMVEFTCGKLISRVF